ncbi:MAG: hypothetical protein HZB56_10985 [Deltaproteobacteria bacterium]|nr:hypothetical protein [Deltaproteobacteria bacterium]
MLVSLSITAAATGLGWLQPLEAIGGTFAGGALPGGAAAVAGGLVLHALVAALLGILFASALPDDFPLTSSVTVGAGYGLFVAGFMMSVVVPTVAAEFRSLAQSTGGAWVLAHGLFGGALAYALTRLRRGTAPRPLAGQAPPIP